MVDALLLLSGLIALYVGADWLVKGASRLAISLHVQPVIVGLTVVAFGTSLPEFVVSLLGAVRGLPDIAIGNIVGSNIANIGLILGLSSLLMPLSVHMKFLTVEVPFMIGASFFLLLFSIDGKLSRIECITFTLFFSGYVLYAVSTAKREAAKVRKEFTEFLQNKSSVAKDILLILMGLGVLIVGAEMLLKGAVSLAQAVGISELIIGVTIIAVGTSLPELATSVVAAMKKETDISIGNIVGSNIFNIFFILGIAGTVRPIAISSEAVTLHMPVMIFFSVLLFLFMNTGNRLSRFEGVTFLLMYVVYCAYIIG